MTNLQDISDVIYRIYQASADELIQVTFSQIEKIMDFDTGTFFLGMNQTNFRFFTDPEAYHHPKGSKSANHYFDTYRDLFNQDFSLWVYNGANSRVVRDSDIMSHKEYESSPLYLNIYEPLGLYYSCKIVLIKDGLLLGIFKLYRKKGEANYSDSDMESLQALLLHIQEALYHIHPDRHLLSTTRHKLSSNFNLTEREFDIASLIANGLTNKDIAFELDIAESTVKKHVTSIFQKFSFNSRYELIRYFKEYL